MNYIKKILKLEKYNDDDDYEYRGIRKFVQIIN